MDRVLVTGGAGFIGSHLCTRLVREGFPTICLDNFNNAYPARYKRKNIAPLLKEKKFSLITGDITERAFLRRVFRKYKVDRVVHLAARAGIQESMKHPEQYAHVNILGTVTLLKTIQDIGKIKQIIFTSSSSVYGDRANGPFRENDSTDQPISPYAATKKSTEVILAAFARNSGIPITTLRLFSVYGPRGRPDMVPYIFLDAMIKRKTITLYGNGACSRDFTYIDDVVDGLITSMRRPLDFEIINLGSGRPVRIKTLTKMIESVLKKKAKLVMRKSRPGDVRLTFADTSWAKKLLSWEPTVEIEEGIERFVDWYLDERA